MEPGPAAGPEIPDVLPDRGLSPERIHDELVRVTAGSARIARAGWMGHMDPPPTWASVLGAAGAALLNDNLLVEEMSPSLTRLEEDVTRTLAREVGLGPEAGGTFTAGGSLANVLALAVARHRVLERAETEGVERCRALGSLTVVTSEDAHTSVRKSAALLGLDPAAGVAAGPPDPGGRLRGETADRVVGEVLRAGRRPFCLVATAGTTVLGAIDPLRELAAVAAERDLWYHVDAAYGGSLALSRMRRGMLEGIGEADSVTLNPHKWLYVARVCALALFRDPSAWREAMRTPFPYAGPAEGGGAAGALQVEGTRAGDVLKLRLSLLQLGRGGFEDRVERGFAVARRIEEEVRRRRFLELAAPVHTNIVVFRWRDGLGAGRGGATGDAATATLRRWLLEREDIFLSLPLHRGARWLRVVVLNPRTDEGTVARLFRAVDAFAATEGEP